MDPAATLDRLAAKWQARGCWPEAEFQALFQQHYARLAGLMTRVLGDVGQAEEVAGDAFWKLYQHPQLQAEGNNIPGWLYRTASRLALDRLRARGRRFRRDRAWAEHNPGGEDASNPLRTLLAREEMQQVRAALARLKPAQAELLLLRYSGLSYAEIANAAGMKFSSVGTTLARAEAAFARAFGGTA